MKRILFISFILSLIYSSCENKEKTLFVLKSGNATNITFNNRIVETDTFNILTEEYIFNGGGVAIADFDNDNRNDILFTGNQVSNQLYLNKGDFKFEDISAVSGIEAKQIWSTGAAVVDINLDGWMDIYICVAMANGNEERRNMLFVNQGINSDGTPTFKEMAKTYGIDDNRNSMNATFFDYDKDGLLDLYVLNNEQVHELPTNYRTSINDGTAVSNDRLYRNQGDGTFEDVTIAAGILYVGDMQPHCRSIALTWRNRMGQSLAELLCAGRNGQPKGRDVRDGKRVGFDTLTYNEAPGSTRTSVSDRFKGSEPLQETS